LASRISLVVGLGNYGPKYENTRHNAGFWFVDHLAREAGAHFKLDAKFHGELCKVTLAAQDVWLLKPHTFMNRSGLAVRALAQFYRIAVQDILVAHDEIDIPPGALRIKQGGGHAGHNGLRDIIAQMGGNEFMRLRIGVGRPATGGGEVVDYVLNAPTRTDREAIEAAVHEAAIYAPQLISGELQKAMNHLHGIKPPEAG
jgi:PTH1 family peptidyl-tRNA hydrolase